MSTRPVRQGLSLSANDFQLFNLPEQFELDPQILDQSWKQLQQLTHPDKHVNEGAAAQRLALQWSVRVNEAYQRMRNPLRRAAYLCELRGAPISAHTNTAMPSSFLSQQIEWREALDDATSLEQVASLLRQVRESQVDGLAECARCLDVQANPQAAAELVRALMFIERFESDVLQRLDQLEAH